MPRQMRWSFLGAAFDQLLVDLGQRLGDAPAGVVGAELGHVADVADVVALSVLVDVAPLDLLAGEAFGGVHGLEHAARVWAAAAEVVDLAGAGGLGECLEGADDVEAVDVVADLLALVAEDRVLAALFGDLEKVVEETVELDAAVIRTREAAAPEGAGLEAEVLAVLLGHDVGGDL